MGRLSFGRVLDSLCLSNGSSSCFCTNSLENQDEYFERKPLVPSEGKHLVRLKDVLAEPQTLAFQLKPKMVVLRVSMHCHGCARKVEKHISKIEVSSEIDLPRSHINLQLHVELVRNSWLPVGVTSYQVDLETKKVVVTGDIVPFEVLESVSKVKNAELWTEDDEARQPPHSTLSP
ncbi:hypothetical protein RHSIM_Rhsim01G0092800 [Rhododendron simsii]|uniref:HMA domain-containing protein n=1 Tax=Rhododendron simsii TaxID=118357 RepID=A0A834HGW4_RHOSS|nr:hypothetical protein RHSIM_Rhsim01G0092800 [Rhododendron simsii]